MPQLLSSCWLLLLACCCCCGAASAAAAAAATASEGGSVAWWVQLSDLHINVWTHPRIAPDLSAFGERVLSTLRPAALLVTGDLVDAKTRAEGSQQHLEEWQTYEATWRGLAAAAGLPPAGVLDLRGNHDVFDTLRGTGGDHFSYHSASAAAATAQAAGTTSSTADERVRVTLLQPQVLLGAGAAAAAAAGGDGHAGAAAAAAACPAAVLVGLDLAPGIGLHGPGNFFGVASARLLAEVAARVPQARAQAAAACGGGGSSSSANSSSSAAGRLLPVVSYSHYPFSTVGGSYFAGRGAAAAAAGQQQHEVKEEGGRALARLLGGLDVAAHLSGHLHDLVGPHMHALYAKQPRRGWSSSSSSGGGVRPRDTYLADLECSDWKRTRRWRLAAADSGTFSFADLTFRSSSSGAADADDSEGSSGSSGGQYVVGSVDASRLVGGHVMMITHPGDGRYGPLHAGAAAAATVRSGSPSGHSGSDGGLQVRVLVVPLALRGANSSVPGVSDVRLQFSCLPRAQYSRRAARRRGSCGSRSMQVAGTPVAAAAAAAGGGGGRAHTQVYGLSAPLQHEELLRCCTAGSPPFPAGDAWQEDWQLQGGGVPQRPPPDPLAEAAAAAGEEFVLSLQAVLQDSSGGWSSSELRPVRLLLALPDGSSPPQAAAAAQQQHAGRLRTPSNVLEVFVLSLDGPAVVWWMFWGSWGVQIGALAGSRLFMRQLLMLPARAWFAAAVAAVVWVWPPSVAAPNSSSSAAAASAQPSRCRPVGITWLSLLALLLLRLLLAAARLAWRGVSAAVAVLLLPAVGLAAAWQHHTHLAAALAVHCGALPFVPWLAVQLSSSCQGLGLWLPWGLLAPLPADVAAAAAAAAAGAPQPSAGAGTSWVLLRSADARLITALSMTTFLAPLTLWCGMMVAAWHAAAAAAGEPGERARLQQGDLEEADGTAPPAALDDDAGPDKDDALLLLDDDDADGDGGEVGWTQVPLRGGLPAADGGDGEPLAAGDASSRLLQRSRSSTSPPRRRQQQQQTREVGVPVGSVELVQQQQGGGWSALLGLGRSSPAGGVDPVSHSGSSASLAAAATTKLRSSSLGGSAAREQQQQHGLDGGGGSDDDEGTQLLGGASGLVRAPSAAAAALLRGASQALLLPVVAILIPDAAAAAAAGTASDGPGGGGATTDAKHRGPRLNKGAAAARALLRGAVYVALLAPRLLAWAVLQLLALVPPALLLLVLPVAGMWFKASWRLAAAYGPAGLLLSPVVAWLPLLLALWLARLRREVRRLLLSATPLPAAGPFLLGHHVAISSSSSSLGLGISSRMQQQYAAGTRRQRGARWRE